VLDQEEKEAIIRLWRWVVMRMLMGMRPEISEMMDTVRPGGGKQSQEPQHRAEGKEISAVSSEPAAAWGSVESC
jgi:hypothetical protein